jgi:hypothetical protein
MYDKHRQFYESRKFNLNSTGLRRLQTLRRWRHQQDSKPFFNPKCACAPLAWCDYTKAIRQQQGNHGGLF